MGFFQKLMGNGTDADKIKTMLKNGALIIDVRSPGEFQGGHVAGAKNIPLQEIDARMDEIKKIKKPLVLCCASGNRSGQACSYLKSNGVECENGGGWKQLNALV